MIAIVIIPFPPSANAIWRNARGRTYLSKEYKQFLKDVALYWKAMTPDGWRDDQRYFVRMEFYPGNRRKYDVDNRIKPVLDALTKAGAWKDDVQVEQILARKGPIKYRKDREAVITIESF